MSGGYPMKIIDPASGDPIAYDQPSQVIYATAIPVTVTGPADGAIGNVVAEVDVDGFSSLLIHIVALNGAQLQVKSSANGVDYAVAPVTGKQFQVGNANFYGTLGTMNQSATIYQFPVVGKKMRVEISTSGTAGQLIAGFATPSYAPFVLMSNLGSSIEARARSTSSPTVEVGGYAVDGGIRARSSEVANNQKIDQAFDRSSGAAIVVTGPQRRKYCTAVQGVSASASTDITILSAGGASITARIHEIDLVSDVDVTLTLKDGATTRRTIVLKAGVPYHRPFRSEPYFEGTANTAVVLSRSGNAAITYFFETKSD